MDPEELENAAGEVLAEDAVRNDEKGYYHPSEITACTLKTVLNKLTGNETELNCYLFQGSAVHYYLQESGLFDDILMEVGVRPYQRKYEIRRTYSINDEVSLTGQCDVLISNSDESIVLDIKYTSLLPEYGHGRLLKYFSQANIYAHMFGVDNFGLFMIHSKSDNIPEEGINVMTEERDVDNWENMKMRAMRIHNVLETFGWEPGDEPVDASDLDSSDKEFWRDILTILPDKDMPAYDEECKYCDYKDSCPVYQGEYGSGLKSALNNIAD